MLNNPSQFDPANGKSNREALLTRYRYVLAGMASMGSITEAQAAAAAQRLPAFPVFKESQAYGGQKGHMLSLVRQELHRLGFTDDQIDGGGLRVTTTFTPKAMAAAKAGVLAVRPKISDKHLHVAVASVQPGTGALVGFYGGQNYLRSQINWAEAGGMVGSTFKPVSLAAGITDGYSLKSTWDGNSPYVFPDGLQVHNEGPGEGTDYGAAVSSVYALEQSINTAFVDLSTSMKNGPDKILTMANKMGIPPAEADPHYPGIPDTTTDLQADALITLGKSRVSAINMANTYATIANGGQRADVHVISKVTLSDGTVQVQVQAAHHPGGRPRHRPRRQLRHAAGRAPRHGRERAGARPPRGRQDRYGDQRRRRRVVVVVRGLHAAAVHRGDVCARQRQRCPQRLAAAVQRGLRLLRRGLPDGHLDRGDEGGHARPPGRAVPAPGQRPGQAEGPRARAADPAAGDPQHVAPGLVGAHLDRADVHARRPRPRRRPARPPPPGRRASRPATATRRARPSAAPRLHSSTAPAAVRPSIMASREPYW